MAIPVLLEKLQVATPVWR